MSERTEIVVVGGRLAGLAAATHAARAGRSVTLFERAHKPGGRARTRKSGGFRFNLGPHALYPRSRAELSALGVEVTGGYPKVRFIGVDDGQLDTLPTGPGSLLTTGLLSVRDKVEVGALLARLDATVEDAADGETLAAFLERRVHGERGRRVMETAVRIASYAHAPERISARAAMAQVREGVRGVTYVDGGWRTIVDGLADAADAADAAGVERRTDARVDAVIARDRVAAGVVLASGERVDADAVILAIAPADAAALAPWSAALDTVAAGVVSVRAACLDLALETLPRPDQPVAFGIDRPLYLSTHSQYAERAPAGGATLLVVRYLAPDEHPDPAEACAELETYTDLIQPGWRGALVEARFFPGVEVQTALPDVASGGLAGRTPAAVPDAPGLYVVGDWVGPEGMLTDAVLLSAREAATLAIAGLPEPADTTRPLEAVR